MGDEFGSDAFRDLADREEIRNLIARYGPLADSGDRAGVAALWMEDGGYDVGGYAVARGRAEIAALIDAPTHRDLMAKGCAHLLGPPAITLDGDTAIAVNHSVVLCRDGDGYMVWRVSANRWELARTACGWRVKLRINRPLDGASEALGLFASF